MAPYDKQDGEVQLENVKIMEFIVFLGSIMNILDDLIKDIS